jgi:hypothetical protein
MLGLVNARFKNTTAIMRQGLESNNKITNSAGIRSAIYLKNQFHMQSQIIKKEYINCNRVIY